MTARAGDATPTGAKGFALAVRKKLYENVVGSVATAILAIATAIALFVWNPLKSRVEDHVAELKNISAEEALAEARSTIGSRTLFAVPFRNRDDESQYIAVWYEIDYRNDPCDSEKAAVPNWCALQLGPIAVDILIGDQGTYERQATQITAGTAAGGDFEGEYRETVARAAGKPIQRFWGIVDRDGDGRKEVLSIADSTGTAPTLPTYVSLFETATGKVRQLRSYPSRFSVKNEFHGVDSSSTRTWLIARLKEFYLDSGDVCARDLTGKLSCAESAALKRSKAEDVSAGGDIDADLNWMLKADRDWVASNGVDFTEGRIKLSWDRGRFKTSDECTGRVGNYEWVNVFKGPLIVNDLAGHRRAVAYIQDGDHHREIPAVVFGKRYVWLALAVDRAILAIDSKNIELKRFSVPEFANGVPQSWSYVGKPPEMVSQEELRATKDYQLDGLMVDQNRLFYGDLALTLPVPADEFSGAKQCPAVESP